MRKVFVLLTLFCSFSFNSFSQNWTEMSESSCDNDGGCCHDSYTPSNVTEYNGRYYISYELNTTICWQSYQLDGKLATCPDHSQAYITKPEYVSLFKYQRDFCSGCVGGTKDRANAKIIPTQGLIGKFNVVTRVRRPEREQPLNPFNSDCTNPDWEDQKTYEFCRLQANGGSIGTAREKDNKTKVNASSNQQATISILWDGTNIDYCSEVLNRMGGTYTDPNGSIHTISDVSISQYNGNYSLLGGLNYPVVGFGSYTFNLYVKDVWNRVHPLNAVVVEVVPDCYFDLSPVVSFTGTQPLDSYKNGYGTSADGGYILESGTGYSIDLNTGNRITNFDGNYIVTADDGNGGAVGGQMELVSNGGNGKYLVKINPAIGSYRIYISKVSGIPGSYCNNYLGSGVNLFVGGSNASASSNCLVRLPEDISTLFPIYSTTGITYALSHFSYTVTSKVGIIVSDGTILTDGGLLNINVSSESSVVEAPDLVRNWTQDISYDNDGTKISESKLFFDNKGKVTQSQSKNFTSDVVLASEVIYDKYGRSIISTLPAPILADIYTGGCPVDRQQVGDGMSFLYKNDFITNTSNVHYSYKDVDDYGSVSQFNNPIPVASSTPGTLGWYYSNNNTTGASVNTANGEDKFIEPYVDASSFPYSRSIFEKDGTNTIESGVGAGDVYRNTSTGYSNNSKVETITIAANDQDVLDYLAMRAKVFPADANAPTDLFGLATKAKITDEKGRVSYSIYDRSGNVIISVVESNPKTISYNFFDDVGRTRCTVTPNGVAKYDGTNFSLIDKTTYEYNYRGWLLAVTESDAGRTEYKYRKDGALRFSQSAQQRASSPQRYSYIHYDQFDKVMESGEYVAEASGIQWSNISTAILNARVTVSSTNDIQGGGLTGGSYGDRTLLYYDGLNGINTSPFIQEFIYGKVSCTKKVTGTTVISTSWYSYDDFGRNVKSVQRLHPISRDYSIEYVYAPNGNVSLLKYQDGRSDAFYHAYEYNKDGGLTTVYSGPGSLTASFADDKQLPNGKYISRHASYSYYLTGGVKREELGPASAKLQGEDFIYNIEGKLKAFNNPGTLTDKAAGFSQDVFAFNIDYYVNDYKKAGNGVSSGLNYGTAATDHFNGNIKGISWIHKGENPVAYAYEYTDRDELKQARFGTPNFLTQSYTNTNEFEESMSYDRNGNIKDLLRTGVGSTIVNDFTGDYQYIDHKNQLDNIAGYADYEYDAEGRIISIDYATGTDLYLEYNSSSLVRTVYSDAARTLKKVSFVYDEAGQRIMKRTYGSGTTDTETWYILAESGNILSIYDRVVNKSDDSEVSFGQMEIPIYGLARVGNTFHNPINDNYQYLYEFTDHLGSVRTTILSVPQSGQASVADWQDYYPYGMIRKRKSPLSSFGYRYKFQGQYAEHDEETGLDAFQLRMYDAAIGRWIGPDPYREFYSSYVGMGNNPIRFADPDGGQLGPTDKKGSDGDVVQYNGKSFVWAYGGWAYQMPDYDNNTSASSSGFFSSVGTWLNTVPKKGDYWYNYARALALSNRFGIDEYSYVTHTRGELILIGLAQAAYNSNMGYGRGGGSFPKMTSSTASGGGRNSFSSMMSPSEAARYKKYWSNYSPRQVTPGTKRVDWQRTSERTGRSEDSRAIYDDYGRQIYRVDYSDHMMPKDHSNPHLHQYEYGPGYHNEGKETLFNF